MTVSRPWVVIPAIPPRVPPLSLLSTAIIPDDTVDIGSSFPGDADLSGLPADLRKEIAGRPKGEGEGDGSPAPDWTKGFTYQPENHGAAWLRDACDGTTIDLPPLPAPTTPTLTPVASGGTLTAAAHAYVVTALDANGETTPSPEVSHTNVLNDANVLTWDEVADAIQYNVYGRVHGSLGLLATVGPFAEGETPTWTDTGAGSPGAAPPVDNTTGGAGIYSNPSNVEFLPYVIEVMDRCSTLGWEARDFKGRALRWLDNATPRAIGREFWQGDIAVSKSYPNNYLTNSSSVTDITPGTVPSVTRGLQILEDALQQCGFGGQGMIHMQAQAAPSLVNARRVGKYLLDIFDNFLVPDVGYPGTAPGGMAPAAGYSYMYATDMVMVRSEDEGRVYPDTFSEALDRGQAGSPNTITFRAERFGAAYFDAQCHFACKVALPT